MKNIVRKTRKEREQETTCERIKVSDSRYHYWACDRCLVAFFGDDEILQCSDGYCYCPNLIETKGLFTNSTEMCKNQIYGGEEETFNKYYKLAES